MKGLNGEGEREGDVQSGDKEASARCGEVFSGPSERGGGIYTRRNDCKKDRAQIMRN